ncbi:MAG: S8 family serine peptidase, partial [Acidobacteriota bacterium]|nr:S8 family serine peptidase [Acidobacteriota bacterium]
MKRRIFPLLLLCLCAGILLADKNSAVRSVHADGGKDSARKAKLSAGLRACGDRRVGVVLQLNGKPSGKLNSLLSRAGVHVRAHLKALDAVTVELPASMVDELASFSEVEFVSADAEVASFGHVSATTGTDLVRTQTTKTLLGTTTTTLDGSGVGIAIIDSGVDTNHSSFLDKSNGVRVVKSVDFTGEGITSDPYGHGTHVAAAAAGNGRISNAAYVGVAPNANIINLRVLNSKGAGSTSALLAALDWVLQNRTTYNVRVVNLSLGTPAVDSYRNDPLCKAVRKVVDAGVVVVAAAGNNGKDSAGRKVYGQIHSPGDEPSALTVGAANTFGTDARSDDAVTTYSSRGPTRGAWTDPAGVVRHDNLIKPDLVAPGNKLVYAESANNLLVAQNPQLDAGVSGSAAREQMYLNGTSMAAPVAAGAAALLLQANPKLTPNMVKVAMMYT